MAEPSPPAATNTGPPYPLAKSIRKQKHLPTKRLRPRYKYDNLNDTKGWTQKRRLIRAKRGKNVKIRLRAKRGEKVKILLRAKRGESFQI